MPYYLNHTAYIALPFPIDLAATFECGQAFRWKMASPGVYEGIAGERFARVARTESGISISPCDEPAYEGFWRGYLGLDGDWAAWSAELMRCEALTPAVSRCAGLRILRQPVWECLVSFILSSNNNVKRISGIVERLCARYGRDIGCRFAFPGAESLASAGEAGIRACGAGYRAEFVAEAARAVMNGFDPEALSRIGYEAAKKELLKLKGVGEKVADCVLLYSCGYGEAFPVDVWVGRAMRNYFPEAGRTPKELRAFAAKKFGKLAGLAQQYLFHYERCLKDR